MSSLSKVLLAFVLFAVLFFWFSPVKVVYTMDRSLDYHWWLWSSLYTRLNPFDYVEFIPPVINQYTKGKVLVKQVVCMPGDRLSTSGLNYYCNGLYIATARTHDSKGREVKPFAYDGVVPADCYFVVGTHERSYDSRYMGFACKRHIRAKLYPIAKSPDLDWLFLEER